MTQHEGKPPSEGTWAVFAEKVVAERDEALRKLSDMEFACRHVALEDAETLAVRTRERDEARAQVMQAAKTRVQYQEERDEARALLAALREAALERDAAFPHATDDEAAAERGLLAEAAYEAALAATPATLAGQVRARVLREAADMIEAEWSDKLPLHTFLRWLRAHADEAEK